MVTFGQVIRHQVASITDADQWWAELAGTAVTEDAGTWDAGPRNFVDPPLPGSGLVAFGTFVFDPENSAAQSTMIVPEMVIGRRGGRNWQTTIGYGPRPPAARQHPIAPPRRSAAKPPRQVTYADGGLSGLQWQDAVAEVVERITTSSAGVAAAGLDKVVLARDLLVLANSEIDPRWLVQHLSTNYHRCWTYLVDGLVGATPEMLVRRESGLATSRVLAGTIRRSGDNDQDLALAAALSQSSKDLTEHEYAVASVARALAPHCSGMNVPDAPYVLELPNVLHLATDVTAVADHGGSSLALAAALHPSAAVCGTPTNLARATIAELERMDRGRYAGPVGWIDADGDGEWAIALRCGQLSATDSQQIRLFAGCGIVAGSDPAAELAELAAKLLPMRDALGPRC